MIDEIKDFLQANRHCVLATSYEDKPYCSLMAYICDNSCKTIYMASYSDTRKVFNLKNNNNVSLIIDSRGTDLPKALTVEGKYINQNNNDYKILSDNFINKHPYMESFLNDDSVEFIGVEIKAFTYIKGLKDPFYLRI
jgi:general stress protein 26